jgi:predicted PhzF superfamily epimerase YddE/YHI9
VFDLIEELDFAGHPLLGAAGVLHSCSSTGDEAVWTFQLRAKTVKVITSEQGKVFGRRWIKGGLNSLAKFLRHGEKNSPPH